MQIGGMIAYQNRRTAALLRANSRFPNPETDIFLNNFGDILETMRRENRDWGLKTRNHWRPQGDSNPRTRDENPGRFWRGESDI